MIVKTWGRLYFLTCENFGLKFLTPCTKTLTVALDPNKQVNCWFLSQSEPVYQQKGFAFSITAKHFSTSFLFYCSNCLTSLIFLSHGSVGQSVRTSLSPVILTVRIHVRLPGLCRKSRALFSKGFDNAAVRLQWAAFAPWQPALFPEWRGPEPPGATNTTDEMHSRWNDRAALFSFIFVPSGRLGFLPVCVHESASVVFTRLKYVNQAWASEAK